jgi:predicted nuclease of predicted toxin-antitoxin system
MKGILIDENLPSTLRLPTSLSIEHVTSLGRGVTDTRIWEYAREHDLVIVTKDADFFEKALFFSTPPRIVWVRHGNMRRRELEARLASAWPVIERLLSNHSLVEVFENRFEVYG